MLLAHGFAVLLYASSWPLTAARRPAVPAAKYHLYRRSNGTYYQQDIATGIQESLRTKDKHAAKEKVRVANKFAAQPQLNLDLARIYLRAHGAD